MGDCVPIHVKAFLLIFLVISSLTHWLIRSILFDFHIYINFSNFFILRTSNFMVVREHALSDVSPFQFIGTCFMAYHAAYLGGRFVYTLDAAAVGILRLLLLGGEPYRHTYVQLVYPTSLLIFSRVILFSIEKGALASPAIAIELSLSSSSFSSLSFPLLNSTGVCHCCQLDHSINPLSNFLFLKTLTIEILISTITIV